MINGLRLGKLLSILFQASGSLRRTTVGGVAAVRITVRFITVRVVRIAFAGQVFFHHNRWTRYVCAIIIHCDKQEIELVIVGWCLIPTGSCRSLLPLGAPLLLLRLLALLPRRRHAIPRIPRRRFRQSARLRCTRKRQVAARATLVVGGSSSGVPLSIGGFTPARSSGLGALRGERLGRVRHARGSCTDFMSRIRRRPSRGSQEFFVGRSSIAQERDLALLGVGGLGGLLSLFCSGRRAL
mmetsp:Transcript_51721/g.136723  ORF Transcript_51721/g.136723 Transcript_51721/m.136723 type:complete len:240 (+) Transcript_51721:166-885(+)